MGCASSNATAPEANVVKQRRRLSVGNVDASPLAGEVRAGGCGLRNFRENALDVEF